MTKTMRDRMARLETAAAETDPHAAERRADAEKFTKQMIEMIRRVEDGSHDEVRRTQSVIGEWAWSIRYGKGLTLQAIWEARRRASEPPISEIKQLQYEILEIEAEGWRQIALGEDTINPAAGANAADEDWKQELRQWMKPSLEREPKAGQ